MNIIIKRMSSIKFRLAKPSDAKQIANCHWHVRDRYSRGIFLSLGEGFLRSYYTIILNDPWEVIVCAEKNKKIIGFSIKRKLSNLYMIVGMIKVEFKRRYKYE